MYFSYVSVLPLLFYFCSLGMLKVSFLTYLSEV
jgi:hypothetical protein